MTARFEYDYRKTLGDLLVDAFYKTATELSNEHGLRLCAEAGGPGPPLHQVPVDALKAQGTLDIPRGEFWKDHDVCHYYGDQGFNFVPPKHIDPSLGYGYDYDVTNAEVVLTRMRVKDGKLTLPDGLSYELLVLPEREDIDLAVLKKIEELVQAGATIVGAKPTRTGGLTDYPQQDAEVRRIADRLWGPCDGRQVTEHTYGKGRVIWGRALRDILEARGVGPDFSFAPRSEGEYPLDYIHRRTDEADIYFVSNKTDVRQEAVCVFRVPDKTPELWMPDTGDVRGCESFDRISSGTRVPLRLEPYDGIFVVFRGAGDAVPSTGKVHVVEEGREIAGPWQISFPGGWGAPASRTFANLISWTDDSDPGVKYFSGVATYRKEFDLSPDELAADKLALDLGRVRFVADVRLNGRNLGILWKPPFRIDVTDIAVPGRNELVVEVANTWSNRLVGDACTEGRDFCRTNIAKSLTWTVPWKETPLLESGLLGPVRLLVSRKQAE